MKLNGFFSSTVVCRSIVWLWCVLFRILLFSLSVSITLSQAWWTLYDFGAILTVFYVYVRNSERDRDQNVRTQYSASLIWVHWVKQRQYSRHVCMKFKWRLYWKWTDKQAERERKRRGHARNVRMSCTMPVNIRTVIMSTFNATTIAVVTIEYKIQIQLKRNEIDEMFFLW